MSVFTAKRLKEARNRAGFSQDEVAKKMNMSRRRLNLIESDCGQVTSDEIMEFARLYDVDVRELLLESYVKEDEVQLLCRRYVSFLRLLDKLSDRDREDVIWVIKRRVEGKI